MVQQSMAVAESISRVTRNIHIGRLSVLRCGCQVNEVGFVNGQVRNFRDLKRTPASVHLHTPQCSPCGAG